jgi:hypothetical protein
LSIFGVAERLANSGRQGPNWKEIAMRYIVLSNVAKDLKVSVLSYDMAIEIEKVDQELAKIGVRFAGEQPQPTSNKAGAVDYSEEAIPERDPAYRPLDDTLYKGQTVEVVPAEVRLALARRLEQLGMNSARAAMVARL